MTKKTGKFTCLLLIALMLVSLINGTVLAKAEDEYEIGISQLVEHPALDLAREGFLEGLAEEGYVEGDNLKVYHENAQAEMATAQTIAQKFQRRELDLVLAIATKSAQAAANVLKETPLLFTAVTDPVEAGLVESMEKPGKNVTGTTDLNPVKKQLELIKAFLPEVTTVGILYNSGEVNSRVQVDIAKEAAPELDLEIKEGTVTNTSEVTLSTSSLVEDVDALYIPTDNVVVSAISSVLKIAHDKQVPVFGSERGQVDEGAVATRGINYLNLGKQTGKMAARVLEGADPAQMPVESSSNLDLIINQTTCQQLDLEIPEALVEEAEEIIK